MKYTKKQIKEGFIKWNTFARLNPSKIKSDEDVLNADVKQLSEAQTKDLLNYINN
jgi:hypothetical protein